MRKMKKITAYLCAFACATSLLSPVSATDAKAASIAKASVVSTRSNDTLEVPVFSKVSSESSSKLLEKQGRIGAGESISYTLKVKKPVYLQCNVQSNVYDGSIQYVLTDTSDNVITEGYTYSGGETDQFSKSIAAGTYTLTVKSTSEQDGAYYFNLVGYDASKTGTIKEGASYMGYSEKTVYKKIKVSKTGCLAAYAVDISYDSSGTSTYGAGVTLCDSKKKALSARRYTTSSSKYINYYGVKKGTYYLKIDNYGYYGVSAKIVKKAGASAAKKAKGKKVTSSGKYYVIPASKKKNAAWFKFNISKPKKVTLSAAFNGDYSVKMSVYKGSKQVGTYTLYNGTEQKIRYKNMLTGKETTWPKGTYYVKIQKSAKTDSGVVRMKLK